MTKDLIGVITEGTMRASVRLITDTGSFPRCLILIQEDQVEAIVLAVRKSLGASLPTFLEHDCRSAVDAHLPEPMLREMLNVYCNHAAMTGLQELESFLAKRNDA